MTKRTSNVLHTLFSLLTMLIFLMPEANATHTMGMDLTYNCIGNNQYQVTLTFYRDCNGISAPSSPMINWSAACGNGNISLQQTNMVEITPSCPGIVGTACNNGNGIFGIEEYTYTGVVTLPVGCTDVSLSYRTCCRNGAITTLATPLGERLYVEATISNGGLCNNSPVFSNKPVPFGCVGQPVFYNHGALDADGDQLVYSMTDCYDAANAIVGYATGYSATNPLSTTSGVSIDANTGAISFTPNIAQVGVLCVLVEEFRNGTKVGEVVRDIQFTAVNCNNNVPTLSGIDNTTNYSTTATVGTALCFDVFSSDPDGDPTFLTWNNAIAAGTFTSAGTPFATGNFCWTPTAADVGIHTFTVNVSDNFCPIVGQNTYTYTIDVQAENTPCDSIDMTVLSTSDLACTNSDGAAVITAANGVAPYDFQLVNWTSNQFFNNSTGIFDNLTAGTYTVWVVDANGCTPGCTGHTFTIGGNASPLTATVTTTDVPCPSNALNVIDSTNSGGSLTVAATGGTAPYLYSIDGINFQSSNLFTSLGSGTYTAIVLDANGCSELLTAIVGEPDPISIALVSMTPATCGQSNGSVTISATGGDGSYLYYLNGQAQGSPTFNGLAAGTYTFSVCDMNYCLYDTTITVPGTPGITATITSTDILCAGDCNGTASVTVGGTTAATTVTWSNGATGATIGNLCAGTYTATVVDANGCEVTASVTLTDPDPITVSVATTVDESCTGNDGEATLAVTGGTAPYTIDIANFSNGTTASNNTGVFTGLNGGQYVTNVTDANGCSQSCAAHFRLGCCPTNAAAQAAIPNRNTGQNRGLISLFQVNPNPASTMVQAAFKTDQNKVGISILNGAGQAIYKKETLNGEGSLEINIQNWAAGTYFVVLRGQEGQLLKTQRLIIRK